MTLKKPVRRKFNRKSAAKKKSDRRLTHETLERRELLAAGLGINEGPRLISISANSGEQFDLEGNNLLPVAPTELTLRFGGELIDESTLAGIQFRRSGGDGSFNEGNEIQVTPGFIGFEQDGNSNIIVARFAETLPDDQFIIEFAGFDDTTMGIVGLRDVNGDLLCPPNPLDELRPIQEVRFDIEVGPRVVGVVPQPVELVNGNRIQRRDQVWVYFNEDPLSNPNAGPISSAAGSTLPVVTPDFYKLIYTGDTIESTDDPAPFIPTDVTYDPLLNRAVLTFANDLSELAPAVANEHSGTFRLRVGSGEALPAAPQVLPSGGGSDDTFDAALPLGVTFGAGTQSILVTDGLIQATEPFLSDWPGAADAVGSRDQRRDAEIVGRFDTVTGINVFPYNFASLYGEDPQQNLAENAITEAQKQRAREVLDLYSERLGVSFVETENEGLQIVTGDLRAIVISADTGAGTDTPLSIYRSNDADPTQGVLVLDAAENWFDGYGLSPDARPSWFVEAVRGIGSLLGIGNLFHLPEGVGAGGSSPDEPNSVSFSEQFYPDLPVEPSFLSQSDVTLGQALHRPESNDVDFYSFTAASAGRLSVETFAERLDGSSLLDTHINVYQRDADGEYILIARNDDFYSDDSFVGIDVELGSYIIGISSTGNENYSGEVSGSGLGGVSEGRYEMRVTFTSTAGGTITDTTGTRLDGDADGREGGDFNFWFRVARDLSTAGTDEPRTIFVDKLGDDVNNDGALGTPLQTISAAFAIARPGDLVRLLPNGGADGLITTTDDNLAYEIGIGGSANVPLSDGAEFEVPRGVTVMIDAGAILKLQQAKISVGSESVDEDRSLASLQVLGSPVISEANGSVVGSGEVIFTSYSNEAVAVDTNPLATTPAPGQWAGIEFRNDFDNAEGRPVWETEGIFLDYVSHANISYGGGSIAVNEPIVTPIQVAESRPTIIYNTITDSADAALSADPNSFLETNFHSPVFQRVALFTSDYDRVGPEIAGNTLINNSINGLFVRVNTPAAGELEPLTVSGRFDDTDVVHSISQVLVLQGQPGGPILSEERPDVLSVQLTADALDAAGDPAGILAAGTYDYRLTFVDLLGNESLASLPTLPVSVVSGSSITLNNLAPAPDEFSGRRLYRFDAASGNYVFVQQLDRGSSSFEDTGETRGGILRSEQSPNAAPVLLSDSFAPGTLFPGNALNYRFTFVDSIGGESLASDPSSSFLTPANGSILLSNLPAVPESYVGIRIYRLDVATGDYVLVVEQDTGTTQYLDNGDQIGGLLERDGNGGNTLIPRLNARLSIDPGTIVKLQNARIEAGFGADFYAEGVDGQEVVFTSRLDDTFGAGGTFDTNNDGVSDNAAPADWGGLIFRQDSIGSLDFATVRFGGGSTPTQGAFTDFNAIEILQADVRIANSTIQDNGAGFVSTSTRDGIGFNDEAAIFVRGSQPIIVDNIIQGNEGAAISINPNALDFHDLLDVGRSTGSLSQITTDQDNQGPLISGNRLDLNSINALHVRSEVLTTESVWDDTDIVHYVDGQVISATHHLNSGLRLKSDPEQSLVVKHDTGAELIGTGVPLDIEDRVGGTIQVLGTPGNPVVLTSINDCTVGAGFTPDGRPMNDTLLGGACSVEVVVPPPTVPHVDIVLVVDESASLGPTQAFTAQFVQDLEAGLLAAGVGNVSGNRYGAVGFGGGGADNLGRSILVGGGLFGTADEYATATSQFVTTGAIEDGFAGIDFALDNYSFRADAARFIILATDEDRDDEDRSLTLTSTIANLQANDIALQGILGINIQDNNGLRALAIDSTDVFIEDPAGPGGFTTQPGGVVIGGSGVADYLPLVQATGGIAGDLSQIGTSPATAAVFGQALIASIVDQAGGGGNTNQGTQGDWQGVTIGAFANDRNVAHIIETEDAIPAANARNAIADDSQRIGDLAADEFAGDETERLGFNIRGTLADENDVDVYSFTATGGTTVFFDIDDTSFGLDTVLELVDVNDNVLASSDNSFAESSDPSTLISNLPDNVVRPLFLTGVGNAEGPNPLDAGFRVILPGSNNSENLYFVRVRSANGNTSGQYTLGIRLREADEVSGSTVQFADIRFATNAINVTGAPLHSPLTADAQESLDFTTIVDPTPENPESGDEFVQESANNRLGFVPADVDQIGNLLTSDRGSLLVTGEIGNINVTDADIRLEDVDVYQVDLFTQQIEPDVFDSENRFVPVTFDIDYADGLGRVNTSISVYNSFGQLILHSRDSNIADDVGRPLEGVDSTNLAGGSAAVLDAFIGPVELPEGSYFVVVGNAATVPTALDQFFDPESANTDVRVVPINSVRRIAEDTLDEHDIANFDPENPTAVFSDQFNYTAERPIIEPIFDQDSIVPYTLDDIRLFVSLDSGYTGTNQSGLISVNPFTGEVERVIGQSGQPTDDIALRRDGELFSFSLGPETGAETSQNVGNFLNISPVDAAASNEGDDTIVFQSSNQQFTDLVADNAAQLDVHAVTFPLSDGQSAAAANSPGFIVGSRDNNGRGFEIPTELTRNIFYQTIASDGEITSRGNTNANAHRQFTGNVPYFPNQGPASADLEWGIIDTGAIFNTGGDEGTITGIGIEADGSSVFDTFFAVTDNGGVHSFIPGVTVPAPNTSPAFGYDSVIPTTFHGVVPLDPIHAASTFGFATSPVFTGMAMGPRVIENGLYRQTIFASTEDGWLYALEINEAGEVEPANVFYNGRAAIPITFNDGFAGSPLFTSPTGIAFSHLEESLFQQTGSRGLEPGHGLDVPEDRSRTGTFGGQSLYFGVTANDPDDNTIGSPDDANGDIAPGGSHGSIISRAFSLEGYSPADQPTLYFTYFLEVEENDDSNFVRNQNDSFRVFGSGDDGEWQLLATNNNFRELVADDEFDYFNDTNIPVQELFDDTQEWRQSRVDLGPLAGSENVRIRFDFSTAGSMRTQFGSVDFVAVPGDEVIDREQLFFTDNNLNQIVLETIVGRDVVFPGGVDLDNNDQFTVTGPDGPFTIRFVTGPPSQLGDVQINAFMSANDVAEEVLRIIPGSLNPANNGDGSLSFLAATDIGLIGDIPVGQSNPVQIDVSETPPSFLNEPPFFDPGSPGATQLVIPDGSDLTAGESFTLFGETSVIQLTYVNFPTGAPGEVVFANADTADDIARRVVSLLPSDFGAIFDGNGVINFLNPVTAFTTASTSQIVIDNARTVNESRIRITPASGDDLIDGETLTLTSPAGTTVVTFTDTANPSGPGAVSFQAGDTVATIATRLLAALPDELLSIRQGNDILVVASGAITDVAGTELVLAQVPSQTISFPSGANLIPGESIRLNSASGFTDLQFFPSAVPGPPGTISYLTTDSAAVIRARVAAALAFPTVNSAGGLIVYGATAVAASEPTSQISSAFTNGQSITPPAGADLIDGESIDVTVGGVVTTIQFVDTAGPVGPNQVAFQATDSAGQVATRLLAATETAWNPTLSGNTVFFVADTVVHQLGASDIQVVPGVFTENVVNLDIPDATELRNGEQIDISNFGFFPTDTITFILRGSTVPDAGTIQVFYDPTDLAEDLYAQIVDGLSVNHQVYIDPTGAGINIFDEFNSTFATLGVSPVATLVGVEDVVTYAIPVTIPNGSEITSGETLTVTTQDDLTGANAQTFTLVDVNLQTGAPSELTFDPLAPADVVAADIFAQLPIELQPYLVGTREIYLLNASSVQTTPGSHVISYQSSLNSSPILVTSTMTTVEVAERLQAGFADGFGRFATIDGVTTATSDNYKVYGGDRIKLFNVTPQDAGAFGVSGFEIFSGGGFTTTPVPGDEFGEDQASFYGGGGVRRNGALDNEVQGVFIDDIIVGFAERGELVLNAPFNDTSFVFNPETLPDTHPQAVQPERQNEILVGGYSLEIRTSDEYGVEEDYNPINLQLSEQLGLGRSFDTNDRLVDGAVTLIVPPPSSLIDGDTFTLDDGDRLLTFEFDSTTDGTVTPGNVRVAFNNANSDSAFVARAVRDAINSAQVQSVLNITAATSDSLESGVPTGNRVELFGENIAVNHSGGRFLKVDLVDEENFQGRESSRQIPVVDHTTQTVTSAINRDELPRSAVTQFVDGGADTLVAVGRIGDNVATGLEVGNLQDGAVIVASDPSLDWDSIRVYLEAGDNIDIDVDTLGFTKAGEVLDLPVITVLEQGRFGATTISGQFVDLPQTEILAQTSLLAPTSAPGESQAGAFLQFQAPTSAYYDIVVSSTALFLPDQLITDFGEYQLTVRPNAATSAAVPDRDVLMVDYQFGISDTNRVSPQGQIIISSNFVSDSAQVGIRATNADRDVRLVGIPGTNAIAVPGDLPTPGSAALLRNQNTDSLIPGVVISNNVVVASGDAAILLQGDTNANGSVATSSLFGRIVNNTVVGQGVGDGIRVAGSASPTILNNVVAFFDEGIVTTADQFGDVIIGNNAYQNNTTNATIPISTSAIVVPQEVELFEDPARRIYIPATGSNVIDSSFASLPDRADFLQTVKEPVGISPSPIIAPGFDVYGQARVDDPLVATPGGVGINVFIDRGAIDRADTERPVAVLVGPQDAVGLAVAGGDQDVDQSFVRLAEGIVEFFDVQLTDTAGTGLDPLTINSSNVILTENGRQLTPDEDYIFGYSSNSRTIRLTPLTGLWRSDSVYEITINNRPRIEVTLPAGDQILDGDQVTTIEEDGTATVFEFDSGFSLQVPQSTLLTFSGTNADLTDEETLTITSPSGITRTIEVDLDNFITAGSSNIIFDARDAGTVVQVRDAFLNLLNSADPLDPTMTTAEVLGLTPRSIGASQLQLGTVTGHTITSTIASADVTGVDQGLADGDTFTYTSGTQSVTFQLTEDALVSDPSFVPIAISNTDTPDEIAQAIAAEIALDVHGLGLGTAQAVGNGTVLVGGVVGDVLTLDQSGMTLLGSPGVTTDAVVVPFIPTTQFTSASTAAALQAAIRNSAAGVTVTSPGAGTLLISDTQLIQATFGGSVPSSIGTLLPAVSDLAGNPVRETRITDETRFTIIMPDVVFDYGDAPASFGTLDADNGARHTVSSDRVPRLGNFLDTETDGASTPNGDDTPLVLNATETGLVFTVVAPNASTRSINIANIQPLGGETLTIQAGDVTATFELTLSTSNPAQGNVPVNFVAGDTAGNIARNLSQAIRAEIDGIDESIIMTVDTVDGAIILEAIDDEDGISTGIFVNNAGIPFHVFTTPGTPPNNVSGDDVIGFLNPLDPAGTSTIVNVVGAGLLDAWVDFDRNGFFEADEQVISNVAVVNGENIVNFFAPSNATQGDTWMRVRISESGNLTPTGVSVGGEVEDFEISVLPIALPVPVNDQYTAIEDTTLVVDALSPQRNLLSNDQDLATQILPVRYFVGDQPQNGTLTVLDELTGEFTYEPNEDFFGIDTFTYRLSTQQNSGPGSPTTSTFATVTIDVQPINDIPGAQNQSFIGVEDTTLAISAAELLAGATGHASPAITTPPQDESDQILHVESISSGGVIVSSANATATTDEGATISALFDAQGFITTVLYTPAVDFNSDNLPLADGSLRTDEFEFTLTDDGELFLDDGSVISGVARQVTATATVTVTPTNDPPDLTGETINQNDTDYLAFYASINAVAPVPTEDTALVIPTAFLLANDFSGPSTAADEVTFVRSNDGAVSIVDVSLVDPATGQISLVAGDVNFIPADDIFGDVEFVYQVVDQGVDEAADGTRTANPLISEVTATIFLEPINDNPFAFDRSLSIDEAIEPAGPAVLSFTSLDLINGGGLNANSPITITGTSVTIPDGIDLIDGETFSIVGSDGVSRVVELTTSGSASVGTDVFVSYTLTDTADVIAGNLAAVLRGAGLGGSVLNDTISFIEVDSIATDTYNSGVTATATSVSVLDGQSLTGGEVLTVTDTDGRTVTFEFSATGLSMSGADVLVPFNRTDTAENIAGALQTALANNGFGSAILAGAGGDWIARFVNIQAVAINDPTSQIARDGNVITLPEGGSVVNGETITIDDGAGTIRVVEFNTTGTPSAGTDFVVVVTATDTADAVAASLQATLRSQGFGVIATGADVAFVAVDDAIATEPLTSVVVSNDSILLPAGASLIDGERITITFDGGLTAIAEFTTDGVFSADADFTVLFNPLDSSTTIASRLEAELRSNSYAATAAGGLVSFVNTVSVAVEENPNTAGNFPETLAAPFNEVEQSLRVVAFETSLGTIDVAVDGNGTHTLTTSAGGLLTFTFAGGAFTTGSYEPPIDYNQQAPFQPNDLFTYTIEDNGQTTIPGSNATVTLPVERSLLPATVTITVNETNDPPTFDTPIEINILEDVVGFTVPGVITNVLPSMASALDEVANQTVSFQIVPSLSTVPAGLMTQDPIIDLNGGLTFFPATDQIGTAVYVIRGTDADPNNPNFLSASTDATVTVQVRPVNDAPRFDPLATSSDSLSPDEAYSVVVAADGSAAPITYTLREDNTQAQGLLERYFIPLQRDTSVIGYSQIGLLDVFTVGPDNELDSSQEGGSQQLTISSPGNVSTTTLGGTIERETVNGTLVGFFYTPPQDFNNEIGTFDSFTYEVIDNSTVGGETFVLSTNVLTEDNLRTSNTVFFDLTPVNDRPEFTLINNFIEVAEDSGLSTVQGYAVNIAAGPQATAFDEVDATIGSETGQEVNFSLALVNIPPSRVSQFFEESPAITPDGTLTFEPAENVFGEFVFEVVLNDDGIGNATRGDLISSDPQTITISVLPVNDSPVLSPNAGDLSFTLLENSTIDIQIVGDTVTAGLLDVFLPGPDNESDDITPGGNQTVSLATPITTSTTSGGSLTQIFDETGLTNLRYTPRPDFTGEDSFIYTVTDDGITVDVGSNIAQLDPRFASNTVNLTVLPVNDEPIFSGAGNVVTSEDFGPVVVNDWATSVLAGPATAGDEIANQNLSFVFTQTAGSPALFADSPTAVIDSLTNTASLSFQAAADANGVAVFEVFLLDDGPDAGNGDDNVSITQTFTIRVNAVNDPPSFTPGGIIQVAEDSGPFSQSEPWAGNVSAGPNDESSQNVRFEVTVPDDAVDLFRSPPEISDTGFLRFTPAANANGTVDLDVQAFDSDGGESDSVTLRIIIDEVNDTPRAVEDDILTNEDVVFTITSATLLGNDIDPDLITNPNEFLTVVPQNGERSIEGALVSFDAATGSITYDPTNSVSLQSLAPGESIVDSFTYSVVDAAGATSTPVLVNVTVAGVNDAPVLNIDQPTLNPNGPTVIRPLDNDTDIDGFIDPSSISITLQPAFGTIAVADNGIITYTPFGSFSTEDQFRYTVADNLGLRGSEGIVSIAANVAPIAVGDIAETFIGEPIDVNVAANDMDPDGQLDLAGIIVLEQPQRGQAIPQNNGTIRYVPNLDFVGTDTFVYSIPDQEGRFSEPATVSVRVSNSRLQNPDEFLDVNGNGNVSPLDALLIINFIADNGLFTPVAETDRGPNFYDTQGDQDIDPVDAILVINFLADRAAEGGAFGEQVSISQPVVDPVVVDFVDIDSNDAAFELTEQPITTVTQPSANLVDASVEDSLDNDNNVIDLIAFDDDDEDEEADRVEALDAAFGDLI